MHSLFLLLIVARLFCWPHYLLTLIIFSWSSIIMLFLMCTWLLFRFSIFQNFVFRLEDLYTVETTSKFLLLLNFIELTPFSIPSRRILSWLIFFSTTHWCSSWTLLTLFESNLSICLCFTIFAWCSFQVRFSLFTSEYMISNFEILILASTLLIFRLKNFKLWLITVLKEVSIHLSLEDWLSLFAFGN